MAYGVTPTGFIIKPFADILADLNTGVQSVFGVGVDLSPESPDGQFNAILAFYLAEMWELGEDIYHSSDVYQVEGIQLDIVMQNYGHPARLVGETDTAYRERVFGSQVSVQITQQGSPPLLAQNLRDDLEIKIRQLAGVTFVQVIVNETDIVDPVTGLPDHSYTAIVAGGDSQEIAEVLWSTHPFGITSYGSEDNEVEDSFGRCHDVHFERPIYVPIEVKYTVRTFQSACGCKIPTNVSIAELAIENLNNGSCALIAGENILLSWVQGAISAEPGVEVCLTEIAKLGDPLGMSNLTLDWNEIPEFTIENISVEVVESCGV